MVPDFLEFFAPTRLVFQNGAVGLLPREVSSAGASRVYIVTDGVLEKIGLVERVVGALQSEGVEVVGVFSEVPPDSEVAVVESSARGAADSGAEMLVAVGGGSVLDTAKAANILFTLGGELLEHQGINVLTSPLKPLAAIPTTAGTGSEVSQFAIIKHEKTKLALVSPYLAASVAILDPEVTVSMPPKLTAATGMDAMTHSIEALLSQNANPLTDALALGALRMIGGNLLKVVERGSDLEARGEMLLASTIAGVAFSNAGVGCVHAMAHALGGLKGVPHGIGNSLLLPHGIRFNLPARPERIAAIEEALGLTERELSLEESVERIASRVSELSKRCGLPEKLSEVGVGESDIEEIAEEAMLDGAIIFNPREVTAEDVRVLLEKAL